MKTIKTILFSIFCISAASLSGMEERIKNQKEEEALSQFLSELQQEIQNQLPHLLPAQHDQLIENAKSQFNQEVENQINRRQTEIGRRKALQPQNNQQPREWCTIL